MVARRCYNTSECAAMLGIAVDTFYRRFDALIAQGMPASAALGRYRPEISSFDAWLKRHHPNAPPPPANDISVGGTDARELLRREYGRPG